MDLSKRKGFALLLLLICSLSVAQAEEITAYRSPEVTVKYDGQPLVFQNNDEDLAPIFYEGITYLPAIAFAERLGIPAQWDQQTQTLSFGATQNGLNFIDDLTPYSTHGSVKIFTTNQGKTQTIAGENYSNWIKAETLGSGPYYNLAGKYSTITFSAYNESVSTGSILFYGDNGALVAKCDVIGKALPATFTVDVSGVFQLQLVTAKEGTGWVDLLLFDMTIQ